LAKIILALADLGAAMPLQEALEQGGHDVGWDGNGAQGPAGARVDADVVVLDAESGDSVDAANAWRDHDPPPALLMVGDSAAARVNAQDALCHVVPNAATAQVWEEQLTLALKMRFAGRMSGSFARAVLGLGASSDPLTDAIYIVKGSRNVDLALVRECLLWHAKDYVSSNHLIAALRKERTLLVPEIEVCNKLDGAMTVQRVVTGNDGETAGRLLWALLSAGAALCSPEPLDESTPSRKLVAISRRHLLARRERLELASYYEVLEVTRNANANMVDHAARVLAMRYAPDRLARIDLGDLDPLIEPNWAQILEARSALMDPATRQRYNKALEEHREGLTCPWAFDVDDTSVSEEFFKRGQAALVGGDPFKAVSGLAGACRNHPDHPTYEAYLCWARFRASVDKGNDRTEAAHKERRIAEEFLLGRRPWPNALVALALLCAADGDRDSARYHLQEALTIAPNLPVAKQLLGRLG